MGRVSSWFPLECRAQGCGLSAQIAYWEHNVVSGGGEVGGASTRIPHGVCHRCLILRDLLKSRLTCNSQLSTWGDKMGTQLPVDTDPHQSA